MKKYTTADALRTHESRLAGRKTWDTVWDEIAYYVLPSQTGFITDFSPGEKQRWSRRFDNTAGYANKKLANHLHMSMVSPSKDWFEVQLKDKELGSVDAVKEWLDDTNEKMYLAFAESNFNAQINTFFQIFCAFGTGCMDVNFQSKPDNPFTLLFQSVDIGVSTFDYNEWFQIDTKVEEFKMTPRQISQRFDKDFASDGSADGKIEILKVTRPNPDYEPGSLAPKKRAYLVEWCRNKKVFATETAYEQPFMVARTSEIKQDGIYGEGFALNCLSDIRSINELKRLELRAAEKAVDKPLIASPNAVMSDLHTEAGGVTIIRSPRDIGELPGGMDIQTVMYTAEDLRRSILMTYGITELDVPDRKDQNPVTATEILIRQEQAQKMLGASVGRIKDELLTPMLTRVFGLMHRNGRLLPMPEELSGADVEISFIGPLAKAQRSDDASAIARAMELSMGIAQMTGKPSKVIDYDKAERVSFDIMGVPASVIRSEDEVAQMEAEEQKAARQQAEQENQMANAQVEQQQAEAGAAQVELAQNIRGIG
ncbi:MAG: hypothetical protein GY703_21520 [Gammaproteobacteria bacterium]|nr:hypothetical protein [Gammaproteobacteria bacterium]